MLEKDTHNLLFALAVFLIGGMVIFGIKSFFPDAFAQVQDKVTSVTNGYDTYDYTTDATWTNPDGDHTPQSVSKVTDSTQQLADSHIAPIPAGTTKYTMTTYVSIADPSKLDSDANSLQLDPSLSAGNLVDSNDFEISSLVDSLTNSNDELPAYSICSARPNNYSIDNGTTTVSDGDKNFLYQAPVYRGTEGIADYAGKSLTDLGITIKSIATCYDKSGNKIAVVTFHLANEPLLPMQGYAS